MSKPHGGVFADFTQEWSSRFPGSELPTAWEEDVRSNLTQHRKKLSFLKGELEKEEMYVDYLNKLLLEIEGKKEHRESSWETEKETESDAFVTVINVLSSSPKDGRGQPDGIDNNNGSSSSGGGSKGNKIRELMANWENRLPIHPLIIEKRSSLPLDRRSLTKGQNKLTSGRRQGSVSNLGAEALYDTVAPDEEIEETYDNHLLYGSVPKGATLMSGQSSADLGFEECGVSLSGTLSSSSDGLGGSPSLLQRLVSEEESNYVNIQYFLHRRNQNAPHLQSDDEELDEDEEYTVENDADDDGAHPEKKIHFRSSHRDDLIHCILNGILDSEALYLEGLSVMIQYMKAMKVTLSTQSPVIPQEDFDVIFYKIPQLHELHYTFTDSLQRRVEPWNGKNTTVGQPFQMLASQTHVYVAFLNNYTGALEALHRCSDSYPIFAELTKSIKLRNIKGRIKEHKGQIVSLEDLLHKPVARVQKHCLSLQDLLKYTGKSHGDFQALQQSLETAQNFLKDYNILHAEGIFPIQQRHLVKNSFIVELSESHRKLRHLFLFNDVLVCAKYKSDGGNKQDKFTFQLKWYIPLSQALIVGDPSGEPKEVSPANILALKTLASSLRDQICRLEREEESKGNKGGGRIGDKQKKKLAEVEAQLVLASPSLIFQVSHKGGRPLSYTFFLSSEYERSQWVETLQVLQASLPSHLVKESMTMGELQSWITTCRKFLKTNMGSFLMRSPRDEPLLVGDLHLTVTSLVGLSKLSDVYVVIEVDSLGHYFRKAKTQVALQTLEPVWNEDFIIELEASENLRILIYEESGCLRGRATLELSRSWLEKSTSEQRISMNDIVLTCKMKFVAFEDTFTRVPSSKPTGLFGTHISHLSKKEKRSIPFIITACLREVERRGIGEVGIYRISGSAADVSRLKRAFESNSYEAEQLLKDCDIHSVSGILKSFLRELPESLFTTVVYGKLFETYQTANEETRSKIYSNLFSLIPKTPNQDCIFYLLEHIVRVSRYEHVNKMSLHNLATVFGPTLIHAGAERDKRTHKDFALASGTVDVMAQASILHFFLSSIDSLK